MDKLVNAPEVLIKIIRIYVDTFLKLMRLLKSSGDIGRPKESEYDPRL